METLINFFSNIPSSYRSALLIGGMSLFWIWESAVPLFRFSYNRWQHAALNIFFTFTTIVINFGFAVLLVWASDWAVANKFGFLYFIEMPSWVFALVGLFALDLVGAYLIHFLEHKIRLMWRFHLIHHTDQQVDVTTANRHHPVESVFRAVFTILAVVISGSPMWLVMLYQSLSVAFSQFNHANIEIPEKLDKIVSWLIVSPNMHKVHHHYLLPLTDTNYGNIFSIWDRIFGTFAYEDPKKLVYGIDTHFSESESEQVAKLLKIPFESYKKPTQN